MPWRGPATVDVEGNVYPCCVQSPENAILGVLPDNDLRDVWNGPRAVDVRRRFVSGRQKLDTCEGCLIPLFPVPVSAAASLLDPFLMRRLLSLFERMLPRPTGRQDEVGYRLSPVGHVGSVKPRTRGTGRR